MLERGRKQRKPPCADAQEPTFEGAPSEVVTLFEQAVGLFWEAFDHRAYRAVRDEVEALRARWQLEQRIDRILDELYDCLETMDTTR